MLLILPLLDSSGFIVPKLFQLSQARTLRKIPLARFRRAPCRAGRGTEHSRLLDACSSPDTSHGDSICLERTAQTLRELGGVRTVAVNADRVDMHRDFVAIH